MCIVAKRYGQALFMIGRWLGRLLLAVSLVGCRQADLTDLNGQAIRLADSQGRWLVLNVWADWCSACRQEMPELNALAQQGSVRVVGYDFDGGQGAVLKSKVDSLGVGFPVVTTNPLTAFKTSLPKALPAIYLVNPRGQLVDTLYGPQTQSGLVARIRALKRAVPAS